MHLPWRPAFPGDGPAISTSITADEAAELGRLAAGRDVLEIGSAYGYSACVMALAGAARVTAVDPHTWLGSYQPMMNALAAYEVTDRVSVVPMTSGEVLPSWAPESFGFAFIDGDHAYDAVLADIEGVLPLIQPGGHIAIHDYGEDCCCPGVRRALEEMFPKGPDKLTGSLFVVEP